MTFFGIEKADTPDTPEQGPEQPQTKSREAERSSDNTVSTVFDPAVFSKHPDDMTTAEKVSVLWETIFGSGE